MAQRQISEELRNPEQRLGEDVSLNMAGLEEGGGPFVWCDLKSFQVRWQYLGEKNPQDMRSYHFEKRTLKSVQICFSFLECIYLEVCASIYCLSTLISAAAVSMKAYILACSSLLC